MDEYNLLHSDVCHGIVTTTHVHVGEFLLRWTVPDRAKPARPERTTGSIVDELCTHYARTLDIDTQQEVMRDGKSK